MGFGLFSNSSYDSSNVTSSVFARAISGNMLINFVALFSLILIIMCNHYIVASISLLV